MIGILSVPTIEYKMFLEKKKYILTDIIDDLLKQLLRCFCVREDRWW